MSVFGDTSVGKSIVEVGCARSAWLPYFSTEFGLEVAGLDYSDRGCQQARALLAAARVDGDVVCADLFSPPSRLVGACDFIVSFGVVEHFEDTAECIAACAELVKPGGTVITLVPNLVGSVGLLQRVMDRRIYDVHVPLSAPEVERAHSAAGLTVIECEYFLSVGYGIVRATASEDLAARLRRRGLRTLERMCVLVWWLEDRTRRLPAGKAFSPYVICVAKKAGCGDRHVSAKERSHA